MTGSSSPTELSAPRPRYASPSPFLVTHNKTKKGGNDAGEGMKEGEQEGFKKKACLGVVYE